MASSKLVIDQNGHAIQALALTTDVTRIAIGATTLSGVIPVASDGLNADVVRIAANASCHIRFGTAGVTASATLDSLFPPGAETLPVPPGATHLAVIQDSGSTGVLTITRLS